MQPGVIPFDLTPRSFAIAVVLLIGIIYATRVVGRQMLSWLLLQRTIRLWVKRDKLTEGGKNSGLEDVLPAMTDICIDRTIEDEEKNVPRHAVTRNNCLRVSQ